MSVSMIRPGLMRGLGRGVEWEFEEVTFDRAFSRNMVTRLLVERAEKASLEKELEFRKKLSSIANQINSAESIPHILMTLKDRILELLDAERLTIYAIDTKNQELYSLQKVGELPKEIRVPKSFSSIAGFTALARKTMGALGLNGADAVETGATCS